VSTTTPASFRGTVPLEAWEHLVRSWRSWCADHPRFIGWLSRTRTVAAWASLALVVAACLFVPRYAHSLAAVIGSAVAVMVYVLVARTRTMRLSNDGLTYVTDDHYETFYKLPNWR